MSNFDILAEQFKTLPVLVDSQSCSGKVYIVTGSNTGLGLETARHLVTASASRVVLAVRNLKAGEDAKIDIERTTGRKGVVDVWRLDMASFASVRSFFTKVSSELDRLDGFVANAGVALDKWTTAEGMETTITINVLGTLLLGALIMPKLMESSQKTGFKPRLVFIVSALAFQAQKELKKSESLNKIFDGLNDKERADMNQRYSLSKLVAIHVIREFASLYPVEHTGVIINHVGPGLASTGLGSTSRRAYRVYLAVVRALFARSPEVASRTMIHGLVEGEDSHGKFLSGCEIKEYWCPDWMNDSAGQRTQKKIWQELKTMLEDVHPGFLPTLP